MALRRTARRTPLPEILWELNAHGPETPGPDAGPDPDGDDGGDLSADEALLKMLQLRAAE